MKKWISLLLTWLLVLSLVGCQQLDALLPESTASASLQTAQTAEDLLEVRFLDVGQADAALVRCGSHAMLIDGGEAGDSDYIYAVLEKLQVTTLDYIISTHPHDDHMGGLSGALNYSKAKVALSPTTEGTSKAFSSFLKYLGEQSVPVTIPKPGQTYSLGNASFRILGPINDDSNLNNISIVLMLTYGETDFLFTGDAETEEEADILAAGYNIDCEVLKVGHHGSKTSSSKAWLAAATPEYAVISVGKGNKYGHPNDETLKKLADVSAVVYRTDELGTIVCTTDGRSIVFTDEKNAVFPVTPQPTEDNRMDYVVNKSTQKFHLTTCSGAARISSENRLELHTTREDMISQGYAPCGICKP